MSELEAELDLWAEESDTAIAADCCSGTSASASTLSTPLVSVGTASSKACAC
ncbi:hypothetical protein F9C11_26725 [Amycolatopsis sp. VS8301801F10]|uniref:hypothetical protein n=1 Tax=unclassified Amycolatopsis TaxID=2618356 RepID=UPI0038FBE9F8